jgi:uncharacterized membrane protein YeiB
MQPEQMALLIPIFGIVFGIGAGIVAIITQARRRGKEFELRHKERMAAIERGLDVPSEPLEPIERPKTHAQYLLRGMVWLGVGIAITFAAGDLVGDQVSRLGAIPAAVGIAYLIYYFVAKPKEPGKDKPAGGPPAQG